MIDTIMFDLDGTLLQFSQDDFLAAYFAELQKVFEGLGMDPEMSLQSVWSGTRAMAKNDGSVANTERFWAFFAQDMQIPDDKLKEIEAACNSFYSNEFDIVRAILKPNDIPKRLVRTMKEKGYSIVLATNPLFPECALETRLGWIGLEPGDFIHLTHYTNSTFCKPNLGYYLEIFQKIEKSPNQCFMAGNNPIEDMVVAELGTEIYLVTDYMENESDIDISLLPKGTLAQLEQYLMSFPVISPSE